MPSRPRISGTATPASAAPNARRRTRPDLPKAARRITAAVARLHRHSGGPRLLGRGDRAGHELLRRRRLEAEDLHPPPELAVRVAVDERRVVAVRHEVARV